MVIMNMAFAGGKEADDMLNEWRRKLDELSGKKTFSSEDLSPAWDWLRAKRRG